ncbi:threonine dehydratase [Luteimonas abyssi]|uniref:threonine dehydratase n=1 Tax=Luteimonas abyssi TaxID=1247514 RepID=UPI0009EB323E
MESDVARLSVPGPSDHGPAGDALSGPKVQAADVFAAQARLRPYLSATPLHHAERFGCWLKLENLQRTGSYKVRGALNALLAARERGDERPVVAASAGNHAQGLAWAAWRLGVPVITVMPCNAPQTKVAGVAHWGATVRQHGDTYDAAKAFAVDLAARNGWRLLSAFDDPDVIAGQGTVGLEIVETLLPDVLLVPIGGGGLAAGVCLALHAACASAPRGRRRPRIVGAQVEGVDAMARRLRGETPIAPVTTLADGVRVATPGDLTSALLADLLDDLVVVREAELRETLVRLALEEHIIAEGAGALALAAGRRVAARRKCAVVSGGNVDAGVLARLLTDVRPRAPRKPRRRAVSAGTATAPAPAGDRAPASGDPASAGHGATANVPAAVPEQRPHVARHVHAAGIAATAPSLASPLSAGCGSNTAPAAAPRSEEEVPA